MKFLSGVDLSNQIQQELLTEVKSLEASMIKLKLAVIIVGDDPASQVYVSHKQKVCEKLGIDSVKYVLDADTLEEELVNLVEELNRDPTVNGILCQLPLPPHIDENRVISTISPEKDVDCFHPENYGLLAGGNPRYMPCTPYGVLQILKRNGIETSGKNVVVLGRSNIVGRPLSLLLSSKGWDATVTMCHSRTLNLKEHCRNADILIAAIGIPEFITDEFVKPGAVVIDVGINRIIDADHKNGSRLVGDVNINQMAKLASAITPVPGGVGPMTISMLMFNTINAARRQANMVPFSL